MNREFEDYLSDILDAMGKAQQFVGNLSYEEFSEDDKTVFALCQGLRDCWGSDKKYPK